MIALLIATRDEASLLRHNIEHHLEFGIDHVAVADNASTDETAEVTRSFGGAVSTLIFEESGTDPKLEALSAAFLRIEERHGRVEWAGISDTDEFWWTPDGDMRAILSQIPSDAVGVNFDQKLFLPTELDRPDGPIFVRRTYRSSGPGSPLHTSYRAGKSFYRGAWLRHNRISGNHWCAEVPHPPWRHERSLVHHYMVDDEESFVRKVKMSETWSPEIRHTAYPRLSAFRVEWWRLYEEQGEEGLREYYRTCYVISSEDLAGHLTRGELVQDTAFADVKLEQMQ